MATVIYHMASKTEPHTFDLELTDTFGGEANYSWVQRETLTFDKPYTDLQFMRAAKAKLGLTGIKCRVEEYGDSYTLKPSGLSQVAFLTFTVRY